MKDACELNGNIARAGNDDALGQPLQMERLIGGDRQLMAGQVLVRVGVAAGGNQDGLGNDAATGGLKPNGMRIDKARALATAVVDSIRDGASPRVMAERYGADADDARLDNAQVDRIAGALGPAYSEALRNVQSGDVVGPFEIPGNAEQPSFVVIKVMRFRPQGEYELDEVRDQIRDQLEQQKRYQALVDQLKQEVYVRMMI